MTAKKTPAPTIVTVEIGQFVGLLADIARSASTDDYMPMINGVMLHSDQRDGQPVLVATATDRYMLGQAHIDSTGGTIPQTFLPLPEVKRLATVLRAVDKTVTLLEITATDTAIVFTARGIAITVDVDPERNGSFVHFSKLFDAATGVENPEKVTLNGRYLTQITAIAKRRGDYIRIRLQGSQRTAAITVGEHYRALLMPVRGDDKATEAPVFPLPSEVAEIAAAVKTAVVKEATAPAKAPAKRAPRAPRAPRKAA